MVPDTLRPSTWGRRASGLASNTERWNQEKYPPQSPRSRKKGKNQAVKVHFDSLVFSGLTSDYFESVVFPLTFGSFGNCRLGKGPNSGNWGGFSRISLMISLRPRSSCGSWPCA